MFWRSVREFYGLNPPFDFKVAIPFLLSIGLLCILLIVWAVFAMAGAINLWTMRFFFFSYLAALLVLGAAASRIYIVSYIIASWCIIELVLGFSPLTYSQRDDSFSVTHISLLPMNDVAVFPDYRFKYHPLMQVVPKEGWKSGPGVVKINHNHLGFRGREPIEADLNKKLIFIYGGSTTYDVAVDQGKTWPEMLESSLGREYSVFNFGVPGYSSSENLVQTAFYGMVENRRPVCALYYLGWNDIHNAYIKDLDPAYADFHLRYQPTQLSVRKPELWGVSYSPVLRIVSQVLQNRFDTMADARYPTVRVSARTGDNHFEGIYREHIRTIAAINSERSVVTIFVGQILNRERLTSKEEGDKVFDWTPYSKNKDMWPFQEHFNVILRDAAELGHAKYIDAGIENFKDADFVDYGHFSAAGSAKFARALSEDVRHFCQ